MDSAPKDAAEIVVLLSTGRHASAFWFMDDWLVMFGVEPPRASEIAQGRARTKAQLKEDFLAELVGWLPAGSLDIYGPPLREHCGGFVGSPPPR